MRVLLQINEHKQALYDITSEHNTGNTLTYSK